MKKTHLVATTVIALAGLYLGCTNPNTVVDPRTPAGNATGTSPSTPTYTKTDATGYWMVQSVAPDTGNLDTTAQQMVLRQDADGTVVGDFKGSAAGGVLKDGTNTNGQLKFWVQSYDNPIQGTISDDGKTVDLSFVGGNITYRWRCTRLM